jgi:hypothetical protein
MGPLTLADFIGLDTCLSIMRVLRDNLGDDKYRPCPLLTQYVDAGAAFYRLFTCLPIVVPLTEAVESSICILLTTNCLSCCHVDLCFCQT